MNPLSLARWQFAITTVYHFIFVPITIGSGFLVAGLQTAWYRTHKEKYLRATKFFGKLFLINFAIGVVTGIVQEFQFGMNWSSYSRFVGDIFGAPLAMEGLLAFLAVRRTRPGYATSPSGEAILPEFRRPTPTPISSFSGLKMILCVL